MILFSVVEQSSNNATTEYPSSPSFDSDLSTSPTSRFASSPTLNPASSGDSSPSSNSSVFIKHFVFSPACHIRIDYRGKLRNEQLFDSGPFLNLLIGLAQLAKVDIYLKRISYKRGLLGYEKLLTFLLNEWLNDIRPTDVIKGIVPLSSISQIIIGIKDLFYLPIDQYRRDGRVLRGIQRGASSFTTSTALALIELSSQVVRCAHFAAVLCFELVSSSTIPPNNSLPSSSSSSANAIMVRNHPPPNDIREGVTYAVNVIRQSFNTTSHQLRTEAQLGRRRKGVLGVVGGLLRQMPSVAIQPIVTTTKAAENFLVGVRNQIDRDERNDDKEKYRSE
jgi:autophagy-related protein 2